MADAVVEFENIMDDLKSFIGKEDSPPSAIKKLVNIFNKSLERKSPKPSCHYFCCGFFDCSSKPDRDALIDDLQRMAGEITYYYQILYGENRFNSQILIL